LIGEVNANVYQALGCVDTVMCGGVRDVEEMRAVGCYAFATAVLVARAPVPVVDFGTPVRIGRLEVRPGDLIPADRHDLVTIPLEIAPKLPAVATEIGRLERDLIGFARPADFTIDGLAEVWGSVVARVPKPWGAGLAAAEHVRWP
ncbi:MAG: hypothetical protein ACRDJW_25065, partial [Thermomicrobiales bacterium]